MLRWQFNCAGGNGIEEEVARRMLLVSKSALPDTYTAPREVYQVLLLFHLSDSCYPPLHWHYQV